jgi:hypothetical protein
MAARLRTNSMACHDVGSIAQPSHMILVEGRSVGKDGWESRSRPRPRMWQAFAWEETKVKRDEAYVKARGADYRYLVNCDHPYRKCLHILWTVRAAVQVCPQSTNRTGPRQEGLESYSQQGGQKTAKITKTRRRFSRNSRLLISPAPNPIRIFNISPS